MTNRLVGLDLPGGSVFVRALVAAWNDGDAVFPIDRRLPLAAQKALVDQMGCSLVVTADGATPLATGRPTEPGDALVVATSGSTGVPKGVVLTREAINASAQATSARIGRHPDDHWLACLPLAHVGGLSVVTRALALDIPLTVLDRVDRDEVAHAVATGATLVSLVPAALSRVDASPFRTVVLGGSRPPRNLPANSVTTYGLTETGSGLVYDGTPLDGVDVRIDEEAVIHVRGPMLLRSYRDGTDPKDADGWFRTGDLGEFDRDGRLVVHGRQGDLIVTGGENVWPDPVEAAIATHPNVADVAVAGRPDDEWGQAVVAFIVPNGPPPTLDDLRAFLRETLPAFAAPKRLVVVDAIPRTAVGKPRRALL